MANNTNNHSNNINLKEDYSMEIRFVNAQQANCSDIMFPVGVFVGGEQTDVLPGGGLHGAEQTDVLPGGGFHGGEQTDVLPGGGFHGGEQTDVLPGGGFHGGEQTDALPGDVFHDSEQIDILPGGSINGRLPMNETYDDSVLHDEVNNEEPPWVKGTFGVDWFFV